MFQEVLNDLLAFLQLALLHHALGLHVRHVPPGAVVLGLEGNLRGCGSVAGGELVVAKIPGLSGVKTGEDILGITNGDRLAPRFQGLRCKFEPAGQLLDDFGRGLAPACLKQRNVAR